MKKLFISVAISLIHFIPFQDVYADEEKVIKCEWPSSDKGLCVEKCWDNEPNGCDDVCTNLLNKKYHHYHEREENAVYNDLVPLTQCPVDALNGQGMLCTCSFEPNE